MTSSIETPRPTQVDTEFALMLGHIVEVGLEHDLDPENPDLGVILAIVDKALNHDLFQHTKPLDAYRTSNPAIVEEISPEAREAIALYINLTEEEPPSTDRGIINFKLTGEGDALLDNPHNMHGQA